MTCLLRVGSSVIFSLVWLSISLALAIGSLFFALIPSCLADSKNIPDEEHALLRHLGALMSSLVWALFVFERLVKYFFAKQSIKMNQRSLDININRNLRKTIQSLGPRSTADFRAKGGRITIQGTNARYFMITNQSRPGRTRVPSTQVYE